MNSIDIVYNEIHISINLMYPATGIMGMSGDGKSFVFDALANEIAQGTDLGKHLCLFGPDNYCHYNRIGSIPKLIYVVDNVDTLCYLYPEASAVLENCTSHMILFGRDFSNVRISYKNLGTLEHIGNTLQFKPLYKE